MRLTLWLDPRRPWPELLALAREAERAQWDSLRFGDAGGEAPDAWECWAVMGALAGAVPRVGLQAVVRDDRGRHPAVVAKLASTVDQLSRGRLVLGWAPGADADGEARLAEGAQVVQSLAQSGRTTMQGRFYRLQDAPLDPKPVQQRVPLMLVGASAALAARWAEQWSIAGPAEDLRARLAALGEACREIGRDRREITVSAWAEYAPAGVDEWVVPAAVLGPERAGWPESLARIRRDTAAAGCIGG